MTAPNPFLQVPADRLRSRSSIKWRLYDPDVLPMWVAEMDVDLAPPIEEALARAVREGDTGYPGTSDFVDAFVGFASRWQWPSLDPALVKPVAGVIPGYTDALVLAAGQGGHVIVTSPVYPPFYSYLRQAGLTVWEARLGDDMRLDLAAIDEAIDKASAASAASVALLLCNPHNPGGTLHSREELTALAALTRRRNVTVVSDEIHAPIVYAPGEFVPFLSVPGAERAVAIHAASKAWNLAAMPAALMVFGPEAVWMRDTMKAGAFHWPSHFGAIAQTAAYRSGGEWLDAALAGLDANRKLLGELLAARLPDVGYLMPEATYLAWLDCTALGLGDDPAATFLAKGRVALNSGPTFGAGGAGHVRLNFATRPDLIDEGVSRMAAALN